MQIDPAHRVPLHASSAHLFLHLVLNLFVEERLVPERMLLQRINSCLVLRSGVSVPAHHIAHVGEVGLIRHELFFQLVERALRASLLLLKNFVVSPQRAQLVGVTRAGFRLCPTRSRCRRRS